MIELLMLVVNLFILILILLKLYAPSTVSENLVILKEHARRLEEAHQSLEKLFLIPQQRGIFGETSLESLLKNSLPPNSFAIREQFRGFIPDAQIFLGDDTILIDSKFPLSNFETNSQLFERDLRKHLDKLTSYPADLIFMYIPSETVYYSIIRDHYDLVLDYANKGVQIVSPLTLAHKLQLLKGALQAKKVSEEAQKVIQDISKLKYNLTQLKQEFNKINSHIRNAYNKLPDVDSQIKAIQDKLDQY